MRTPIFPYVVLRDGTQFGSAETVSLTEAQALPFVRSGELMRDEGSPRPKRVSHKATPRKSAGRSKADSSRLRELEVRCQQLTTESALQQDRIAALEADIEKAAADFVSLQSAHYVLASALDMLAEAYPQQVEAARHSAIEAHAQTQQTATPDQAG